MHVVRSIIILAFMLLAGCHLLPPEQKEPANAPLLNGEAVTQLPNTDAPKTRSVARRSDDEPRRPRAAPPAAPPPGEPLAMDPDKLIGMTQAETTAILGRPVSVADLAPATVWSYRSSGCELDVFFYMDLGARMFRVLAYEMKAIRQDAQAERNCVGRIRAASAAG
jgi:hypothetical protein